MGQFTSALDLYKAQKHRFDKMQATAPQLHREMVIEGWRSGKALLQGSPRGKARIKALRAAGHPYGHSGGLKRGGGGFKQLPIGIISGRLNKAYRFKTRPAPRGNSHAEVGFEGAGRSLYVLTPGGTRKMVDRGFWQKIKAEWRPRNRALIDTLKERQKR